MGIRPNLESYFVLGAKMSQSSHAVIDMAFLATTLRKYSRRWIVPTGVVVTLSALFVIFHKNPWHASQALLIRAEAAANLETSGKFDNVSEMKTAQETVVELARSESVIREALNEVGAPAKYQKPNAWPTAKDIATARKSIRLTAPNGAEFGLTEIFYLSVRDVDPDRAIRLTTALCDRMETRLQRLRDNKAKSLVIELAKASKLAHDDLDQVTERLTTIETEVGNDLADLRMLGEMGRGQSTLRTTLSEIRTELRNANQRNLENSDLLVLLASAQEDANSLIATPNSLLTSQPSLRRLKDGLVDAQLRTSEVLGQVSKAHPRAKMAFAAEAAINEQIRREISTAIQSLQIDLKMSGNRVAALDKSRAEITQRMHRLASVRATYSNRVAEVAQLRDIAARSRTALADARTRQATAYATSLVTRLDSPVVGDKPIGPRRAVILIAGLFGGLSIGLGIVFLTVPAPRAPKSPSRRPAGAMTSPAFTEKPGNGDAYAHAGHDANSWN